MSGITDLGGADFLPFFRDVHGYDPFPWQQRLTNDVLEKRVWPTVIDLPTGTGKTAVLDTAVFAMAAQPEVTPRRVVFVIDRRIVVDQVCERARRLQHRIRSGNTPVLQRVRERLGTLSDGEPLGVAALRGGIPVDHEWTQRPDQPWVVVSTVDQFGSRLLFRGYGVRPGMWPIHAGLAGNDCLVILDEVHLSVPFAQTLAQTAALRSGPLPRRFVIVEMSATPSKADAQRFELDSDADLERCAELRRRVTAPKHATLETVSKEDAIPNAVLKIIKSVERNNRDPAHDIHSVGVIVNRVRTARETYQALADAGYATYLITGRMRPLDRVSVLDRIAPIVEPDGSEREQHFSIVVSTQAIEVGADFSFDALVTECAAVDSLRQRFGRLDRRGNYFARTGQAAAAWIVGVKSAIGTKKPDPIYGDSITATWEELKRRAKPGTVDVGSMSLRDFPHGASAPRGQAPLLLETYLDAWTQTSPEPLVRPPIERFLHGMDEDRSTDIAIVWRRDHSPEVLRLVPPRQAEYLQVPIGAAKSWLSGATEVDVADVPQTDDAAGSPARTSEIKGQWVRWGGAAERTEQILVNDIRPGDVLIASPDLRGLTSGTWDPSSSEETADLGDQAQLAYGRRATLRLDPHLPYIVSPPTPADEADADRPVGRRIAEWLGEWSADANHPDWIRQTVARLGSDFEATPVGLGAGERDGYYILAERHPKTKRTLVDPGAIDSETDAWSETSTGATLCAHLEGVSQRAGDIAKHLGLPIEIQHDLRLAGRTHDLGKVDRRFQLQLAGGDRVTLEMLDEPIAKSLPGAPRVQYYPKGMRHELASVALIESNEAVVQSAHDKDLVLHLVATHHGWGRPLPPVIEDPNPQELSYTFEGRSLVADSDLARSRLALNVADRFWRLVQRYGYHGLAWLEAILRLADHQQSAEEAGQ